MYEIYTSNNKVEKKLLKYIDSRKDIKGKLERLKINPRKECGAHSLRGNLKGKWSCWLGSNLRLIYIIDNEKNIIWIEDMGTHKVY